MVYVTFHVPQLVYSDKQFVVESKKFAVGCKTEDEAMEVAHDANSLDGVKNIRFRKCGKPYGRRILTYSGYFNYIWY